MILKAIKYSQNGNQSDNSWRIEGAGQDSEQWIVLNSINLIVGRNASGKTRAINAIRQIATLLSGDKKTSDFVHHTATYELKFEQDDQETYYFLDFKDGKVVQEILRVNDHEKLNRAEGRLYYEQLEDYLDLEIDDDLLTLARLDAKQQPFFRGLHNWGKKLAHFEFGGLLGRKTFLQNINRLEVESDLDRMGDIKSGDNAIEPFIRGSKQDEKFIATLIQDMKYIGYDITNVAIKELKYIPRFGLTVKESDLKDITDQVEMSQGMFRAFSLLIQLNYLLLMQIPSCILIDDIGEGLDYERSKQLINLIIEKVKTSTTAIQVIMTTNDRFVMNSVPLEYWNVIQRIENRAVIYNYNNSKQIFDDFAYTGLNNFDFFATDFFVSGFQEYVSEVVSE